MKKLTPQTANTLAKLCKLPRDNLDRRGYWILAAASTVTICKQKRGESATEKITIPKGTLDYFVRWYLTGSTKR